MKIDRINKNGYSPIELKFETDFERGFKYKTHILST